MSNEYINVIEELSKTFLEHHKEFLKEREIARKINPDSPILKDGGEFSVALALHLMCLEIEKIKNKLT